jgi:hypothetical protein
MRLHVDIDSDDPRIDWPRHVYLDGRRITVVETLDQWHGPNYRYVKLRCDDGNLYILRFDAPESEWQLTMFQRPGAEASAVGTLRADRGRSGTQ